MAPKDTNIAKWRYVCMSSSCGYVVVTNYAPAATKPCPCCGGTLKREAN